MEEEGGENPTKEGKEEGTQNEINKPPTNIKNKHKTEKPKQNIKDN